MTVMSLLSVEIGQPESTKEKKVRLINRETVRSEARPTRRKFTCTG